MDHELAEGGRPLVAVPPVHHEQPAQVLELGDGEVCGQGSLLSFLKPDEMAPSEAREVKANTFVLIETARHGKEIFEELQQTDSLVSSYT